MRSLVTRRILGDGGSLEKSELLGAEVPGSPTPFGPQHVCCAGVMAAIIEALPFPAWEVTGVDLEVPYGSLRRHWHVIDFADESSARVTAVCGVGQGEWVEVALKFGNRRGIVPLVLWPEFLYGNPQFGRCIGECRHRYHCKLRRL